MATATPPADLVLEHLRAIRADIWPSCGTTSPRRGSVSATSKRSTPPSRAGSTGWRGISAASATGAGWSTP